MRNIVEQWWKKFHRRWKDGVDATHVGQGNPVAIRYSRYPFSSHFDSRDYLVGSESDKNDERFLCDRENISSFTETGSALSGDSVSAASFLGIAGLVSTRGTMA